MTGKLSPIKTIRKPILHTPARPTPRRLATPKSVRIQSDTANDLLVRESDPTLMRTPVMVHGGARPKTPRMEGTPLAPPIIKPPHSHTQTLTPRRILSSTPSGGNGEEIDKRSTLIQNIDEKRKILEEQNKKIFHPPPIEGIDVGVAEGLETLDPEIRIPTEEDFVLPLPLGSLLDKAKMAYKFLPKQGDIDQLIAKINKKVLRDTNLCVDLRDLKAAYLTSPDFRDIYLYLLQDRMPLGKGAEEDKSECGSYD